MIKNYLLNKILKEKNELFLLAIFLLMPKNLNLLNSSNNLEKLKNYGFDQHQLTLILNNLSKLRLLKVKIFKVV